MSDLHLRVIMLVTLQASILIFSGCDRDSPPAGTNVETSIGEPLEFDRDAMISSNGEFRPQIFKGTDAPIGEWPEVVGVTWGASRNPHCTGVLIDPSFVLTASHCLCHPRFGAAYGGSIYVGDDWKKLKKGQGYIPVARFVRALSCDESLRDGVDLALLQLKFPAKLEDMTNFADTTNLRDDMYGVVVGFGAIDRDGKAFVGQKQFARVPIQSVRCSGTSAGVSSSKRFGCMENRELIAGLIGEADTCSGDSGGPLFIEQHIESNGNKKIRRQIAAITSRPVNGAKQACGVGGIYELVDKSNMQWILDAKARMSTAERRSTLFQERN